MTPAALRFLHRLANIGLVLALLLATLPFGMKAYGRWTQTRSKREFLQAQSLPSPAPTKKRVSIPGSVPPRREWHTSILQIPSIGVDAVVTEGAGKWELVIGPGHMPQTVGAGGAGNCVIAAHRNLWDAAFSDLPTVKPGDKVHITTSSNRYTYVIDWSREVRTKDKAPLQQTKDARLTLITCVLPFESGRRWVAQGHLVEE